MGNTNYEECKDNMTDFPVLETERLLLREIRKDDAADLLAIQGDLNVMRWYGSEPLSNLAAAENLIKVFNGLHKIHNTGTRWGIERKTDHKLIGTCGFFKLNRNWHSCTLGYELGQYAWRHGFMYESLTKLLTWCFSHMDLNRVDAQIHPLNTASIKLVEKLGFVAEGLLREAGFWGGRYHDMLQFSLLRNEYLQMSQSTHPDKMIVAKQLQGGCVV